MPFLNNIQRFFSATVPASASAARSRQIHLPGFSGLTIHEVWGPFLRQLRKTRLAERASSISFNAVMAIPPTLIFVFTLIPYLPISKQFLHQLFALIRDIVPGEKNNTTIIQFLTDFINRPRNGLLSIGLLTAIFFSSNALMGILRSFDRNYQGFFHRKGLQKRKVALKITMIVYVLVFICILLLIAQSVVLKWVGIKGDTLRSIIHNFRWAIIVLLIFCSVSFIYRYGPALTSKWPLVTPGAVFATTLMIIATGLVTFWANHFSNYNKLYGSIGAIFILMSLIYANALAILLGFELNVTLTQLKHRKERKDIIS